MNEQGDKYYHKYRSRKWLLTVGVQLAATLFLGLGLLGGDEFTQISSVNIAAYNAANAVTNWSSK